MWPAITMGMAMGIDYSYAHARSRSLNVHFVKRKMYCMYTCVRIRVRIPTVHARTRRKSY